MLPGFLRVRALRTGNSVAVNAINTSHSHVDQLSHIAREPSSSLTLRIYSLLRLKPKNLFRLVVFKTTRLSYLTSLANDNTAVSPEIGTPEPQSWTGLRLLWGSATKSEDINLLS